MQLFVTLASPFSIIYFWGALLAPVVLPCTFKSLPLTSRPNDQGSCYLTVHKAVSAGHAGPEVFSSGVFWPLTDLPALWSSPPQTHPPAGCLNHPHKLQMWQQHCLLRILQWVPLTIGARAPVQAGGHLTSACPSGLDPHHALPWSPPARAVHPLPVPHPHAGSASPFLPG